MTVRLARIVWDGPYAGSFEPTGTAMTEGPARAPVSPSIAARFVVGFGPNASDTAVNELLTATREIRAAQGDPDAEVTAQLGRYRHRAPDTGFTVEMAGQVGLVAARPSRRQFEADMVALAEALATRFSRKIVVLDLQEDAVTQAVHCVSP